MSEHTWPHGLLLLLLVFAGLLTVRGTSVIAPVEGAVDPIVGPYVSSLVSAYAYVQTDVTIQLATYDNQAVVLADQASASVDFACVSGPIESATLRQVPIGIYGIVPLINKNPPPQYPMGLGFNALFSPELLAAVYVGNITSWADPNIQNYNGLTDMPQGNITLLVRNYTDPQAEAASETGLWARALSKFDPHGFGAAYNASGRLLARTLVALMGSERVVAVAPTVGTSMAAVAATVNASLSYGLESDVTVAMLDNLYMSDMMTATGSLYSGTGAAELQATLTAYEASGSVDQPDGLAIDISGSTASSAWPFTSLVFALVPQNGGTDGCTYVDSLLQFLAWSQTNTAALALATGVRIAPLTSTYAQRALESMGLIEGATSALATRYVLGEGPATTVWTSWATAYDPSSSSLNLRFQTQDATDTLAAVAAYNVDFGGVIMGSANHTAAVRVFPAGLRGVGCAASSGVSFDLSLDVLADILLGNILVWNDSRLGVSDSVGTGPIRVVLDQGGDPKMSGGPRGGPANQAVFAALSAARPGLAAQVLSPLGVIEWPVQSRNTTLLGGGSVSGVLLTTANAFGCDFIDLFQATRRLSAANMITTIPTGRRSASRSDGGVSASVSSRGSSSSSSMASAANVSLALQLTLQSLPAQAPSLPNGLSFLADVTCDGCWPLGAWMGLAVANGNVSDCSRTTALLDWVWWMASNPASTDVSRMSVATFGSLAPSDSASASLSASSSSSFDWWGTNAVLYSLATMSCDGVAAFSQSACLSDANTALCSNQGTCVTHTITTTSSSTSGVSTSSTTSVASCQCDSGWTGALCDQALSTGSSDNTALIVGVVVGIVGAVLLFVCLLVVVVVVVAAVLYRHKQKPVWWISASEVTLGEKIGRGSYGTVYKGRWCGTEVAVKTLNDTTVHKGTMREFYTEVTNCVNLRHPNIVLFMGACIKPSMMLFEYMPLGSLYDLLGNELIPDIPFQLRIKITHQAAKGMHFLHQKGFVHRDLKSPNVLLDSRWNVKISDFGLARMLTPSTEATMGMTIHWTAPEVFEDPHKADTRADVYAFGIIMWEVLVRARPYAGVQLQAIPRGVVIDRMRPPLPEALSPDDDLCTPHAQYTDLMTRCWDHDPEMRPDFEGIDNSLSTLRKLMSNGGSSSGYDSFDRSSHHSTSHSGTAIEMEPMGGGASMRSIGGGSASSSAGTNSSFDGAGWRDRAGPKGAAKNYGNNRPLPPAHGGTSNWFGADPNGRHGLAFVVTDIVMANTLWTVRPREMRRAIVAHNAILRDLMKEHGGIESVAPADNTSRGFATVAYTGAFCVAFGTMAAALRWCVACQTALVEYKWDEELLNCPEACLETGVYDRVLFAGPRVRMGIHWGRAHGRAHAMVDRMHYVGPGPNRAARTTTSAEGGQILLTRVAARQLVTHEQVPPEITFTVTRRARAFYQAVPKRFEGRWFGHFVSVTVRPFTTEELERNRVALQRRDVDGDDDVDEGDDEELDDVDGSDDDRRESGKTKLALRKDKERGDDDHPSSGDEDEEPGGNERAGMAPGRDSGDAIAVKPAMAYIGSAVLCNWVIPVSNLQFGREIGSGSFGTVYTATWTKTKQRVAVKRFMHQSNPSEETLLELFEEASILTNLSQQNHYNVLIFMGICIEPKNLALVTEYMSRGSLRSVLDDKGQRLTWTQRLRMLRDAARGLAFLHGQRPNPIIHRDVKSSNLLVDENMNVKVGDFGLARMKQENSTMTRCGTPAWTAPEIFKGQPYSEQVDVYSLGIVMWEVLTRDHPYKDINFMQISIDVVNGGRPAIPRDCPKDYMALMTKCWHRKPEKRPTMDHIVVLLQEMLGRRGRHSDVMSPPTQGPDRIMLVRSLLALLGSQYNK